MKRLLGVALGIMTAIGGFVDIGDLVTNALVGSRFGLSLAWATLVGLVGICLYAEMSGRVAAVTGRGTFDLVRERLGPRAGLANLVASFLVTALTLHRRDRRHRAVAGTGNQRQLPVVGADGGPGGLVDHLAGQVLDLENVFGTLGLALLVFGVALWQLHPHWGDLFIRSRCPTSRQPRARRCTSTTPSPCSARR